MKLCFQKFIKFKNLKQPVIMSTITIAVLLRLEISAKCIIIDETLAQAVGSPRHQIHVNIRVQFTLQGSA